MGFTQRLAQIRKQHGFTQQTLADQVGVQVLQIHRYETGTSQPTLEVIRKLAMALNVSTDELIFDDERGSDQELRLQFDAISHFDDDEKKAIKLLLDSVILRHQTKRLMSSMG